MNILYLNHYAGSPALGMEFRPYYLAREWVRAGHRVHMVAAGYSHVRARQPMRNGRPVEDYWVDEVDGIDYHWFPAPPYQGNGLGRVKNIAAFLSRVWRASKRLVNDIQPDIVIASSTYPMDIWVARRLARMCGAKLVFEVHDLWPLSPIELSGMSPKHPFIRLCQLAEDVAYRDADVVISMLPKVHSYMASHGLDLRRLHIVPNGITLEEWHGPMATLMPEVARAIIAAHERKSVVVGYAGSMGRPNALDNLLDAARLMQANTATAPSIASPPGTTPQPVIEFVLVGDGHECERLKQRVAAEGLGERVHFFPPIPKVQIRSFLSLIDIAYIGWQRVPIYRFGIAPNKLMDYMMARRPVLHAVEAGNDPVAEAGCGLTIAPEDPAAVVDGLRRIAALAPDQWETLGERGRQFVLANHTYPVLAKRFLDACGAKA